MVSKKIFREYDIRGVVPDNFNKSAAQEIGNSFGWQIVNESNKINPTVAVGRDVRLSSNEIFDGIRKGLNDAGCNVLDLGVCPTPVTYFSSFELNIDAFVMITGSHNPPEYNGIKLGIGKDTYHSEHIMSIYNDIVENGYMESDVEASNSMYDVKSEYIKWHIEHFAELKEKIEKLDKKIRVVLDAGNGTASDVAPEIFRNLSVEVIELYCQPDGNFPNHHPDPTVEENLQDAKDAVAEYKADFAVAYDGDSDRIGVVDEQGNVIWGDMLLYVYAKELMKTYVKPKIIADVKASQILFDSLAAIGVEGIMWKTGHSLIKNKLKEAKAELAGEMSGHIFFNDKYFGYDDAIYASLRFLESYVHNLADNNITTVSDMMKGIPKVYNTPELRIECSDDTKFDIVEELSAKFAEYKNKGIHNIKDIITLDGIRVIFENGWGLLRASNTQPVLVMRFEASSENEMLAYKSLMEKEVSEIMD